MAADSSAQTANRPTVIDKAVQLLEAFRPGEGAVALSELAARTGMPKSSVHRFATALVRHNLLAKHGEGYYSLGVGLWQLGAQAMDVRLSVQEIEPFARQVAEHSAETVHVGVLDAADVVYVIRIAASQSVGVQTRLGQRVPAHCTATGKALLAWQKPDLLDKLLDRPLERFTDTTPATKEAVLEELERTRERGYAVNFGGWQSDMCGTGAPILDGSGIAIASIGIAGPAYRWSEERAHELGAYVKTVADELSERFGSGVLHGR